MKYSRSGKRAAATTPVLAVVGVVMLLLAACGSDAGEGDAASAPEAAESTPEAAESTTEGVEGEDGEGDDSAAMSGLDEPITLVTGIITEAGSRYDVWHQRFMEVVGEETDGMVTFDYHLGGALGSNEELMASLAAGEIDYHTGTIGQIAEFAPATQVYELPFMFESNEQANDAVLSPALDILRSQVSENSQFMLLGLGHGAGMRQFFSADGPTLSPDDIAGKQHRTIESSELHIRTFETLGAVSVPLAWTEVYNALDSGVVSSVDVPLVNGMTSSLHEPAPYITEVNLQISPMTVTTSKAKWDSWPEALQAAVEKGVREATEHVNAQGLEDEEAAWSDASSEEGLTITRNDQVDYDAFRETVQPIYDDFLADPAIQEFYDQLLEDLG